MIMIFMVNQISILIDTLCWWPTELASTPSSPLSRWHHERPLSCPELGLPTWLRAMATGQPVQGQTRVTSDSEPRSVKQRQTKSSILGDCWLGLTCFVCVNCDLWVATQVLYFDSGVSSIGPGVWPVTSDESSSYPRHPGLTSFHSSWPGSHTDNTDIGDWRYN